MLTYIIMEGFCFTWVFTCFTSLWSCTVEIPKYTKKVIMVALRKPYSTNMRNHNSKSRRHVFLYTKCFIFRTDIYLKDLNAGKSLHAITVLPSSHLSEMLSKTSLKKKFYSNNLKIVILITGCLRDIKHLTGVAIILSTIFPWRIETVNNIPI